MAKQRIVNTKFWDDSYIASLGPMEKLVFLYLLTNPLTNISGVYELPIKRAAFDIGCEVSQIEKTLKRFEADKKTVYRNGWIGIVNFIKHQTLNPKVKQGIVIELKKAPKEIVDRLSIDYDSLSISYDNLSHSNSNLNTNSNGTKSTEHLSKMPADLEDRRRELVSKWRL